ncbi:MAG: hypothetical protein Q7S01_03485 [bacterium]|nr:hypothetical protein [bacterium]
MQKQLLWVLGGIIIIGGGFYLYANRTPQPVANTETPGVVGSQTTTGNQTVPNPEADAIEESVTGVPAAVITFTDSGFSPSSVTVKKGQIVRWVNNSDSEVWPASAAHPSHAVYPQKSASDCAGSAFDSCRGLEQGEAWDFKFDYVGSWRFHNHKESSQVGVVNVVE